MHVMEREREPGQEMRGFPKLPWKITNERFAEREKVLLLVRHATFLRVLRHSPSRANVKVDCLSDRAEPQNNGTTLGTSIKIVSCELTMFTKRHHLA